MATSSKSSQGRKSRDRGTSYEKKLANLMREIYDPPSLLRAMDEAIQAKDRSLHRQLQKTSAVRRSDQGKGAIEPDLVIEGCPAWHELHRGGSTPMSKLRQAERDVIESSSELWPVAITSAQGSTKSVVTMRARTFLLLQDFDYPEGEGFPGIPIQIELDEYLDLLRADHERRRR